MNEKDIEIFTTQADRLIKILDEEGGNEELVSELNEKVRELTSKKNINNEKLKQLILDYLTDNMADYLYYDRKEDTNLPVGVIEQAIRDGVITIDEMVDVFRHQIELSVDNE